MEVTLHSRDGDAVLARYIITVSQTEMGAIPARMQSFWGS